MGKEDRGFAYHSSTGEIHRNGRERFMRESNCYDRNRGMRVMNNSDHFEMWKPVFNSYVDRERDHGRRLGIFLTISFKKKFLHLHVYSYHRVSEMGLHYNRIFICHIGLKI